MCRFDPQIVAVFSKWGAVFAQKIGDVLLWCRFSLHPSVSPGDHIQVIDDIINKKADWCTLRANGLADNAVYCPPKVIKVYLVNYRGFTCRFSFCHFSDELNVENIQETLSQLRSWLAMMMKLKRVIKKTQNIKCAVKNDKRLFKP